VAELYVLLADASKAKRKLGWTPRVSFRELVLVAHGVSDLLRELTADGLGTQRRP
jgi:GDP-D-mannose dehydratase